MSLPAALCPLHRRRRGWGHIPLPLRSRGWGHIPAPYGVGGGAALYPLWGRSRARYSRRLYLPAPWGGSTYPPQRSWGGDPQLGCGEKAPKKIFFGFLNKNLHWVRTIPLTWIEWAPDPRHDGNCTDMGILFFCGHIWYHNIYISPKACLPPAKPGVGKGRYIRPKIFVCLDTSLFSGQDISSTRVGALGPPVFASKEPRPYIRLRCE